MLVCDGEVMEGREEGISGRGREGRKEGKWRKTCRMTGNTVGEGGERCRRPKSKGRAGRTTYSRPEAVLFSPPSGVASRAQSRQISPPSLSLPLPLSGLASQNDAENLPPDVLARLPCSSNPLQRGRSCPQLSTAKHRSVLVQTAGACTHLERPERVWYRLKLKVCANRPGLPGTATTFELPDRRAYVSAQIRWTKPF